MKPSKREHPRFVARDSRPAKPAAGATARVPLSAGPAKGQRRPDLERGARVKAPFERSEPHRPDGVYPDQQPLGEGGRPGEQYLRLRIRVRGDRLSVIDSHLVDGPLSQPTTFHASTAYDVTYQDRLLHAAAVPDIGLQRSFPNPDGPPEQHGHHLTPRDVSEFSARVPATEVTRESLAGIRVRLHRVDEPTAVPRLGSAPLATQFEGRMTPTAELVGLPDSALPEAVEARGARTARGESG
jgi:hypothetical protein